MKHIRKRKSRSHRKSQVNEDSGQGKQDGIQPVKHAPVPRHDVPRILHLDAPLEHRLDQVSETAEHHHDGGNHPRIDNRDAVNIRRNRESCPYRDNPATDGAFPRLLGGNPRKQLVFPERRPAKVGERVVQPHQQEREENDVRLPFPVAQVGEIHQQREGEGEVCHGEKTECQVLESMGVLPVKLPNAEDGHRHHENQIPLPVARVIVHEARREQQAPAHDAHRAVEGHLHPLRQVGELQDANDIDGKKQDKETDRVYENTRCQNDHEKQAADGAFYKITHNVLIL